jgi:NTP pyrophosphatase (non-canonical NTP hydrolase)
MLKKILKIVEDKYKIDKNYNWCKWSITRFKSLEKETKEVYEEMKEENSVHLEDELWDVLFAYLNLLKQLKSEWKITSFENIISRSERKFKERVDAIKWKTDILQQWNKVKKRQKDELKKEHNLKYN